MTSLSLRFLISKTIGALLDCSFTCPVIRQDNENIQLQCFVHRRYSINAHCDSFKRCHAEGWGAILIRNLFCKIQVNTVPKLEGTSRGPQAGWRVAWLRPLLC